MKRVLFLWITFCFFSIGVTAAPLSDYSLGRVSIEAALAIPETTLRTHGTEPVSDPAAYGWSLGSYVGATVGIGTHMALRVDNTASWIPVAGRNASDNYYQNITNFDWLYGLRSVDKSFFVAVFAGMKNLMIGSRDGWTAVSCYNVYGFHGGIQGTYDFTKVISGYFEFGYGSHQTEGLLGAAYSLSDHWDVNVELNYSSLHGNGDIVEKYQPCFSIATIAPRVGATYKF